MIHTLSETELILRVKKGDRKAFAQLYSQHLNSLYRYIYLFTKSKVFAEETVQNVFVKIWERREQLENISSFKSYIFRAAKNSLMDEIRRSSVKAKALCVIKPETEECALQSDSKLIYNEFLQITHDAIALLPEKRKQIVEMRIDEDLSLDEIAERLSISKNVVKKQLYAGMTFVRTHLQKNTEISKVLVIVYFFDL